MTPDDDRDQRSAVERLLDAAARRIVVAGAAETSLADIAAEAGVSKALIHYHFRDKDALLAALVERTAAGIVARQRAVVTSGRTPIAVESLWAWLQAELERGTVRLLLELSTHRGPALRRAALRAAADRRQAAADTAARLLAALDLRPRVPVDLLGAVVVAFEDGLAADPDVDRRGRVTFDVFWLALLNLAE